MAFSRLALASFSVAALALAACDNPRTPEPTAVVAITPFLGKPVLGDPNAPVEITEYASTTCGHCRAFHEEVFPELKTRYIDTGKVKLAWVVLPTAPEAVSLAGGALARCAGETRYFDMLDAMFDAQDTLFEASTEPGKLQQALFDIGAKFDMSPDMVVTCVEDKAIMQATRDALTDMPETITGTPSFVINGVKLDVESFEGLAAAIDAELAKTAAPVPTEPAPQ